MLPCYQAISQHLPGCKNATLYLDGTSFDEFHFVCSYMQPNGYKPTPLDLGNIQLNEKKNDLVELLAENTHNVWAKERIKQGWTYGLNEVSLNQKVQKCK